MTVAKLLEILSRHDGARQVRIYRNGSRYGLTIIKEVEVEHIEIEEQV